VWTDLQNEAGSGAAIGRIGVSCTILRVERSTAGWRQTAIAPPPLGGELRTRRLTICRPWTWAALKQAANTRRRIAGAASRVTRRLVTSR
jgi:hypothetical protein